MHSKHLFTLHFGALHDDIIVEGRTFVRRDLTQKQFSRLRKILINIALSQKLIGKKSK
ncbi:hypothetical protein [Bartonella sp. DGB2]|uniref:hypothetical protein n=1 Tax=Bartonella sp. DGB2 TaxID=3388426 RepID=UPI00398FBC1F